MSKGNAVFLLLVYAAWAIGTIVGHFVIKFW